MKLKALFLSFFFFSVFISYSQNILFVDSISLQYNAVFENLDPSKVKTGILYNKVIPLSHIYRYNGIDSIGYVAVSEWFQLYFEMYKGAVDTTLLPDFTAMTQSAYYNHIKNGEIPLGILDMKFNIIRGDALDSNLLSLQNNRFFDVPGATTSPYFVNSVFAVSPLTEKLLSGTVNFYISDEYYFTNDTAAVDRLEIDFGDGLGLQTIYMGAGQVITINYLTGGEKTVFFTMYFKNGNNLKSRFFIHVANASVIPSLLMTQNYFCPNIVLDYSTSPPTVISAPAPDKQFTVTSSIPYHTADGSDYASATVSIIYAEGNTHLTKPFLLLDGFDPITSTLYATGNVGIGTPNPLYSLDVCGKIRSHEWIVETFGCDFVLENNYALPTLKKRMDFTKNFGHLMYIQSSKDMQKNGAEMANTTMGILRNVEEHELYLYQLNERDDSLEKKVNEQEQEIQWLKQQIHKLRKKEFPDEKAK